MFFRILYGRTILEQFLQQYFWATLGVFLGCFLGLFKQLNYFIVICSGFGTILTIFESGLPQQALRSKYLFLLMLQKYFEKVEDLKDKR